MQVQIKLIGQKFCLFAYHNKTSQVQVVGDMWSPNGQLLRVVQTERDNHLHQHKVPNNVTGPNNSDNAGVTTNSATATNCVSLYNLRGIH